MLRTRGCDSAFQACSAVSRATCVPPRSPSRAPARASCVQHRTRRRIRLARPACQPGQSPLPPADPPRTARSAPACRAPSRPGAHPRPPVRVTARSCNAARHGHPGERSLGHQSGQPTSNRIEMTALTQRQLAIQQTGHVPPGQHRLAELGRRDSKVLHAEALDEFLKLLLLKLLQGATAEVGRLGQAL
jgi:hypothetical protein